MKTNEFKLTLVCLTVLLALAKSSFAATFIVTTTSDTPGPTDTSLRDAISMANTNSGTNTITFNIPGTFFTITLVSNALPALTNSHVTIDGTSQSNYAGIPLVTVDGSGLNAFGQTYAGFRINGNFNTLSGVRVVNFTKGLIVTGQNNFVTGSWFESCTDDGIDVFGALNTFGGAGASDRLFTRFNGNAGVRFSTSGAFNNVWQDSTSAFNQYGIVFTLDVPNSRINDSTFGNSGDGLDNGGPKTNKTGSASNFPIYNYVHRNPDGTFTFDISLSAASIESGLLGTWWQPAGTSNAQEQTLVGYTAFVTDVGGSFHVNFTASVPGATLGSLFTGSTTPYSGTAFTPSRISAAVAAILAPAPNVQVTIEGAGALTFIGDQGALTVTVTNNGSATASNVVVFVYVQNSLGVQAFGVTGGTGVTSLDTKTNTVIFDIPTLAPSASAVVTIPVQVRHADNAGPFGVIADHTTSTIFVSGYPEEGGDYRNPIPIAHGTLSIAPGSNGPTIFTPANGATFLQQTLSLTPTQWVTLPQSSGVSNNSVRTYTIPLTNPSAFLRSFTAVDSGLPSVDIFSVYAEMDDGRHNFGADSDHAIAAVHYNSPGPSGELFFSFSHVNLCYPNGNPSNITHAIANMSLPNGLPEGEPGTVIVSFPLGLCASNPPAFDLTCGWNFTSNADGALPPPTNTVRVIPFPAFMHSGEQGQPVTNIFVQEGGTNGPRNFDSSNALVNFDVPIGPWVLARTNFNNHEQGTNECAPYAVINSLEYVNSNYYNSNSLYHSPYVNPTNLTIGAMKQILHWDTNGAPSGRDSNGVPIAGALSWVDYKKAFMASNNIPIYTSEVTNAIFTNIAPVLTAISNRCDVEIRMVGHVAFVAGIRRLAGGNYSLLLAHDVLQGANGGTMVEQVKFDPYSGQITGTGWGNKFIEFVIECPP